MPDETVPGAISRSRFPSATTPSICGASDPVESRSSISQSVCCRCVLRGGWLLRTAMLRPCSAALRRPVSAGSAGHPPRVFATDLGVDQLRAPPGWPTRFHARTAFLLRAVVAASLTEVSRPHPVFAPWERRGDLAREARVAFAGIGLTIRVELLVEDPWLKVWASVSAWVSPRGRFEPAAMRSLWRPGESARRLAATEPNRCVACERRSWA